MSTVVVDAALTEAEPAVAFGDPEEPRCRPLFTVLGLALLLPPHPEEYLRHRYFQRRRHRLEAFLAAAFGSDGID